MLKTDNKLIERLYLKINTNFQFISTGEPFEITIIDDVFPFYISPWRNLEYISIADNFNTLIYSDGADKNPLVNATFDRLLEQFNFAYPDHKIKCRNLKLFSPINTQLVYLLFYGYLFRYFNHVEKNKLNLAFTLYPGGGFDTRSIQVKQYLRKVFDYRNFKGVIVNQRFSKKYLIEDIGLTEERILLAKNILISPEYLLIDPFENKKWYGIHKSTFDIAFVANKYTIDGADKGFDVFLQFAESIVKKYTFIRFHVVGGFTEKDIPNGSLNKYFRFYGFRDSDFFISFYKSIDVFISPNRPFVIGGNFDGFPLGAAYEAGLCGTVLMMTDHLNENDNYIDNEDFFNINGGLEMIQQYVEQMIEFPDRMEIMAKNFIRKALQDSDKNVAIRKKIDFLKQIINGK